MAPQLWTALQNRRMNEFVENGWWYACHEFEHDTCISFDANTTPTQKTRLHTICCHRASELNNIVRIHSVPLDWTDWLSESSAFDAKRTKEFLITCTCSLLAAQSWIQLNQNDQNAYYPVRLCLIGFHSGMQSTYKLHFASDNTNSPRLFVCVCLVDAPHNA